MVFMINGTDICPYVVDDGIEYTMNDLDGPNAGRTVSGLLIRDRVAVKDSWKITCRPLTGEQLAIILSLIYPEWVLCSYTHPMTNTVVTKTLYSNNRTVQFRHTDGNKDFWGGISFPLIER